VRDANVSVVNYRESRFRAAVGKEVERLRGKNEQRPKSCAFGSLGLSQMYLPQQTLDQKRYFVPCLFKHIQA
jgi:hypothetical protein